MSSITASPHTAKFKFPDTSPLRCTIYHHLTTSTTANFPPVDDAACTQPTPHPPSSCRRFSRHLLMDALSHVCMYDPPLLRRYDLLFILSNACSASMTVSQLPSTQLCYLTISPLSHPVSECRTFSGIPTHRSLLQPLTTTTPSHLSHARFAYTSEFSPMKPRITSNVSPL